MVDSQSCSITLEIVGEETLTSCCPYASQPTECLRSSTRLRLPNASTASFLSI